MGARRSCGQFILTSVCCKNQSCPLATMLVTGRIYKLVLKM